MPNSIFFSPTMVYAQTKSDVVTPPFCLLSCPGRRKGHVCGRRYRASHVRPLGSKVFFYLALFGHPTVTLIKRGATLRTGRRRAAEASIVRRSASHSLSISSWSWQNLVKHASVTRWRWVPTRDLVGRPCSSCLLRRARLLRAVEVLYEAVPRATRATSRDQI